MRTALIIVNYNGGEWLRRCLECVALQSMRPDRVLVIDNASTDQSFVGLEHLHPEYVFQSNEANIGFAAANNRAFEALHREGFTHAALLNPDAFPEAKWFESLVEASARFRRAGSFASRMMVFGEPAEVDGLGDAYHYSGVCFRIRRGRKLRPSIDLVDRDVFGACAGAALYDLHAVMEVGAFDEDYFCYVEDVDLAFRLRLAGYGCRYVSGAVVAHVGSGSSGLRSDFSTYYGQRNLVWTYVKDMPGIFFWMFLPFHVLANVAGILVCAARGQAGTVLSAKRDALRNPARLLSKRAEVQRSRKARLADIWRALHRGVRIYLP